MTPEAERAYSKAIRLAHVGDHASALRWFRRATEFDGNDPRYWIGLGVCLIKLHHWDQAVVAVQRGLDLHPHYAEADARLFLAEALIGAGQVNKARTQLKIVAGMKSSYPSYDHPITEARRRLAARAPMMTRERNPTVSKK
jgi:Flp pilus assembly protein TadD